MSDTAQVAITQRQNGTHPEYTPFNYELAMVGSIALKGFLVVACLYCDVDIKRAEGVTSLLPHHREGPSLRGFIELAVVSAQCTWIIMGGLSLHMVLVSYSSAIK